MDEEQKSVVKGTFWGLAGNFGVRFISFVYLILVARMFSQSDVGTFYLAFSVIYLVIIFGDLGLNAAFTRYVPFYLGRKEKEKIRLILNAAYAFSSILSAIASVLLFFSAGWLADAYGNPALKPTLEILSPFMFFGVLFSLNTSFLTSLKRVKESNMLLNAQNILKLLLVLALFWMLGAELAVLSLSFVFSYVALTILSFWNVRKETRKLWKGKADFKLNEYAGALRELLPFGFMLALVTTLWTIASFTDRVMIGYFIPEPAGSIQIAVYTVAISLATIIAVFPSAVLGIFLPVLSELYGKNEKEKMLSTSHSALRWIVFLITPVTIIFVVFPSQILQMLYGADYAPGAMVLVLFSLGLFIRSLGYVQGSILASMRIVRVELYGAIAATLANIALNWVLIPPYGIEGAALASAISFAMATAITTFFCIRIFGFRFPKDFYRIFIAGAASLAVVFLSAPMIGDAVFRFSILPPGDAGIGIMVLQKVLKVFLFGLLFLFSCAVFFLSILSLRLFREEDVSVVLGALRRFRAPNEAVALAEYIMNAGKGQ